MISAELADMQHAISYQNCEEEDIISRNDLTSSRRYGVLITTLSGGGFSMGIRKKQASQLLRTARLEKGYTQQVVSAMASISIKAYQRLEYGERDIAMANLRIGLAVSAVCAAFFRNTWTEKCE